MDARELLRLFDIGSPAHAEIGRLLAVERAAREFVAAEDRGPFESAVAVRDLRSALARSDGA